jgi:hypothetical protein
MKATLIIIAIAIAAAIIERIYIHYAAKKLKQRWDDEINKNKPYNI